MLVCRRACRPHPAAPNRNATHLYLKILIKFAMDIMCTTMPPFPLATRRITLLFTMGGGREQTVQQSLQCRILLGGREGVIATHPSRTCTQNQPRALACAQRVQPMCTCTCGTASHACAVYRGASNLCCGRVRCNILQRDSGNAWVCGERSKAAQIRSIGKVATAYWLGANVA